MKQKGGFEVCERLLLPDEREEIADALRRLSDEGGLDLILTTGGTGLHPRDITPEATRDVIEREVPGIAELMRLEGMKKTPMASLSRAVCGIRKGTLIINMPGSLKAVRESLEAILPVLDHAVEKIKGDSSPCGG